MAYTPIFEKEYENGWVDFPSEETIVNAHALDMYDDTLEHIENYLGNNDPNNNLAEEYDDTATYQVDDYVVYNDVLYKCIAAVEEAEDFDSDKWEPVKITDEMGSGGGGGTTVIANPVGEPTDDLETIQIGNTIYDIPGGGGGNANIWTGTQAEYEAQASQIADDTVVLITDDEEHTQAFDIYSTDEQVIGTWIDGKPIYRRIYTLSQISLTADTWSATSIQNPDIDEFVDAKIYIISSSPSMHIGMSVGVINNYINFNYYRTLNTTTGDTVRVLLEYTKTTD